MATATDVPGRYPVALNGRSYLVDLKQEWSHRPAPILRQQQDSSISPSEAALAIDGMWRRSQEDWTFGAGQTFRDREESLPQMFRTSKGIDVWTKYQFSLLPDTDQKLSTSSTNLYMTVAGSRIYTLDGTAIKYTTDITADTPTWTSVTGAGGTVKDNICSDGFNVYIADSGTGVYKTDTSTSAASLYNSLDPGVIAYVKGRLMASGTGSTKNSIYNITSATTPSALFTHSNTDFTWVGFAAGKSAIYAAGYSGDKSLIYRIRVKPDATSLDAPVIAGELPDGEIIRSIGGYLGFIFLGTDKGTRFCVPNVQGDLEIGPYIATSAAVGCFEGQDKYVWFGMTNYDGTSTGLGRMCLTQFVEDGLPAYASDLMVTAQGAVQDVVTFQGIRVFTVSGSGVYAEWTNKVASGTLETGQIGYGLPEQKTAMTVDTRSLALPANSSWAVAIAKDSGSFTTVNTQSTTDNTGAEYDISSTTGERLELRYTLTRSSSDATKGPTITRYTLKAIPVFADATGEYITVHLLLPREGVAGNVEVGFDPTAERDLIKTLKQNRSLVTYQDGSDSYTVTVEDYAWMPGMVPTPDGNQDGVLKVVLRTY